MTKPRRCFIVLENQYDEHGYIPSLVTEGEAGHSPLSGDPAKFQSPWYWGNTFEKAEEVCAKMNREDFGLSDSDVKDIVASSMPGPMKRFTITITGEFPSDIPDEWMEQVAGAAEVQVLEPRVNNPDDALNELEFETRGVETKVEIG